MAERPCVLGIDVGTSGCKATLVDVAGRVRGSGHAGYELRRAGGRVEIEPATWLAAVRRAVGAATAGGAGGLSAVAISSANATVLVDGAGEPVMPAIMQLDRRAEADIRALRAELGDGALLRRTGNLPGAGVSWLANLAWMRRARPAALARARSVVFPGGFVALWMTGAAAVDPSRASTTGVFDPWRGVWCNDLAAAVGLRASQLPALTAPDGIVGRLSRGAAASLGLPLGIPVAAGAMDSAACALSADAIAPGDTLVILGTVARTVSVMAGGVPDAATLTARHAAPDRWIAMNVLWGAGRFIAAAAALWSGRPDYERLARELPTVPPGCDGLRFQPAPEGAPDSLDDGLSGRLPEHTPAHVARAVIEGILRRVLSPSPGHERMLTLAGGPTRSPAVPQILADLTGRPVALPAVQAGESLGAAICAASAAGAAADIPAACAATIAPPRIVQPSAPAHRAYAAAVPS
jgi:xylulokinase